MSLVPTIRTACTSEELCKSLITAWQKLFNNIPSKQSICIILGQHQLETGGAACWNNNIGNVKYIVANGDVDYCALNGVWEIINGVRVEVPATNPSAWFRSFPTLDDGSIFYLQFVSGKRYKNAWNAVVAGDPVLFCHELKLAGYYTADEAQYTSAVNSYFNKFMDDKTTYEQTISNLQPNVSVFQSFVNTIGSVFK